MSLLSPPDLTEVPKECRATSLTCRASAALPLLLLRQLPPLRSVLGPSAV